MVTSNVYQNAFSTARPNINRSNDEKTKNAIVIGGMNYGRDWEKQDQAIYDLYLKSLEQEQYNELLDESRKYNSPQNQAALMRSAGLNPDFQNINFNPSTGQGATAPSAPEGESRSQKIANYAGVAKSFIELLPQALNIYSQISNTSLDLQSKQIANARGMSELASDDLFNLFTAQDFDDMNNPDISESRSNELQKKFNVLNKRVESFRPLGKRFQRFYNNSIANLMNYDNSIRKGHSYFNQSAAASNRRNYLSVLSSHGFDLSDSGFSSILKDFDKARHDAEKSSYKSSKTSYDSKVGFRMIESGMKKIENGDSVNGWIEYILGALLSNISLNAGPIKVK